MFLPFITLICLSVCCAQPLYRHQLRGMRQEEYDRIVGESIFQTVKSIKYYVLETAKRGQTEHHFTMMCMESSPPCLSSGIEKWKLELTLSAAGA